jgi:hypothetical protein
MRVCTKLYKPSPLFFICDSAFNADQKRFVVSNYECSLTTLILKLHARKLLSSFR